jgi:hypothetical protein
MADLARARRFARLRAHARDTVWAMFDDDPPPQPEPPDDAELLAWLRKFWPFRDRPEIQSNNKEIQSSGNAAEESKLKQSSPKSGSLN